jgi:hypothetical protein
VCSIVREFPLALFTSFVSFLVSETGGYTFVPFSESATGENHTVGSIIIYKHVIIVHNLYWSRDIVMVV